MEQKGNGERDERSDLPPAGGDPPPDPPADEREAERHDALGHPHRDAEGELASAFPLGADQDYAGVGQRCGDGDPDAAGQRGDHRLPPLGRGARSGGERKQLPAAGGHRGAEETHPERQVLHPHRGSRDPGGEERTDRRLHDGDRGHQDQRGQRDRLLEDRDAAAGARNRRASGGGRGGVRAAHGRPGETTGRLGISRGPGCSVRRGTRRGSGSPGRAPDPEPAGRAPSGRTSRRDPPRPRGSPATLR